MFFKIMKNLRQKRSDRKPQKEKTFWAEITEDVEKAEGGKGIVLDMDTMYGAEKKEETGRGSGASRKGGRARKKGSSAARASNISVSTGYSATTIEATFGVKRKDEFAFSNPLANEVVYDVMTSGGGIRRIARKIFALEQLGSAKSPDDTSPDFVPVEKEEKVEPKRAPTKKTR